MKILNAEDEDEAEVEAEVKAKVKAVAAAAEFWTSYIIPDDRS